MLPQEQIVVKLGLTTSLTTARDNKKRLVGLWHGEDVGFGGHLNSAKLHQKKLPSAPW